MGCPQQSVLDSLDNNNSLWTKYIEAQAKNKSFLKRKHIKRVQKIKSRRTIMAIMKRRARLERRHGRPSNELERKVKVLKKLIPKGESNNGVEGLFRETADYILDLQMRVRIMQVMVNVLSGGSEE